MVGILNLSLYFNAKFSHRVYEIERNDFVKNLSLVFIVFCQGLWPDFGLAAPLSRFALDLIILTISAKFKSEAGASHSKDSLSLIIKHLNPEQSISILNDKFSHRVHEVEKNEFVKNLSLVFIIFMSGALA